MKVFQLQNSEDNEILQVIPGLEVMDRLKKAGVRLLYEGWPPLPAQLVLINRGIRLKRVDLQAGLANGGIIIRESAYRKLKPILEKSGVLLPLQMADEDPYHVFQVVMVECLDRKKTHFMENVLPNLEVIMKPVLRGDCVVGLDIFSPMNQLPHVFVSEYLRDAALVAGLKGVEFKEVEVT
jgi:hypothetical protein